MRKEELKILYMGTPSISAYVLEALILEGYQIIGLITQPDKPVGRKGELEKSPTKVVAEKYNIPVYQPIKIRKDYEFVKELKPDMILTLAYGQIVPQGLLDIPPLKALNLHGSLLPKYRGAAPIQYALKDNETVTGMSLMEMVKEMDAGQVFMKKEIMIDKDDNATTLFEKMGKCAKELILEALPLYINGELKGIPQDESLVTFAPTIKSEEEHLSLDKNIDEISGWIRALSDHPGGYFYLDNLKFKIYKAEILNRSTGYEVGEIILADKNGLVVQLKDGQLKLLEVQKEGKKRMDYKSFINGNANLKGKRFS